MDKKKVLIVSRSFFPDNSPRSFRTTELAKEFARQGHEVTVITPRKPGIHDDFEKEHKLTIKSMGTPSWNAMEVKGSAPEKLLRRVLVRLSLWLFEYPHIELTRMVKKVLENESGYDVMISIAVPYPVHWGVAGVHRKKHSVADVWIADCGDPYMGAENDTFKRPFYFKYVEKWFSRKADFITVPTQGSIQAYYPEFHSKIRVISQGFRFEDVEVYQGEKLNSIPEFGYAGNFIPGRRDPSEIFEYLLSLDIDFRFHIYTSRTDMVAPYVKRSAGKIVLHPVRPRPEVLFELSKMDFVVNFENAGHKQTPSKLIDYAILDKPILSVSTGNLNKDHVLQFLNRDYTNRYIIKNPDQYRIENVCKRFLSLLNSDSNQ